MDFLGVTALQLGKKRFEHANENRLLIPSLQVCFLHLIGNLRIVAFRDEKFIFPVSFSRFFLYSLSKMQRQTMIVLLIIPTQGLLVFAADVFLG